MNKKNIVIIIAVAVLIAIGIFFVSNNFQGAVSGRKDRLKVVATIFPQYDFVREIAGDNVDLDILINPGADSHAYEPSPADIIKVRNADVFIYTGGHGDVWVDRLLEAVDNTNLKVVKMMDSVTVLDEEEIGDEHEHEHEHAHEHSHDHESGFTENDIKDRTLAEFEGNWKSLHQMMVSGKLDEYCQYKAEHDDDATTTAKTYREKYSKSWDCSAATVTIKGNNITFTYLNGTSVTAKYDYKGYSTKKSDSGSISVRYNFVTNTKNAPKYVQFNDHGYKPGKVEHFHLYYGNDGFDALIKSTASSFFMPTNFSDEEVIHGLIGHGKETPKEHEHESEHADEHIWTSPKNAIAMVKTIETVLCEAAPLKADVFHERAAEYRAKLEQLDADFRQVVSEAKQDTVVIADRFPFLYLMKEYNLKYFAAMSGCSSATEASAGVIANLIKEIKHEGLKYVYYIELSNQNMAKAVAEQTGAEMLLLHSCHNLSKADFDAGCTYLSLMQQNVENLKKGLN